MTITIAALHGPNIERLWQELITLFCMSLMKRHGLEPGAE
jgi:hypothetical protein